MTSAFQRQAKPLLVDAGYKHVSTNGSGHEVWRKPGVPDMHVPGSPSGGRDSMLLRVRRAIRKGTALTPPSGQETDMPAKRQAGPPLSAQMVELASSQMLKDAEARTSARERGQKFMREYGTGYVNDQAKWVKRCIDAHGRILGSDLVEAAKALEISQPELSVAKKKASVVSYRVPGMEAYATWVDYSKNLPADATLMAGGSAKTKAAPAVAAHPEERSQPAALAAVEADFQKRVSPADAAPMVVTNGARSQLDAALELLREAALADTHAITPADIMLLRGHQDTLLRCADDMRGVAASITSILVRVQAGLTVEGVPAA